MFISFALFLKCIYANWNAITSSRIWTRVVVSIYSGDKRYDTLISVCHRSFMRSRTRNKVNYLSRNSWFIVIFSPMLVAVTNNKRRSLLKYLQITGRKIVGFTPFLRWSVYNKVYTVSCRVWTRLIESISYADNRYAMSIRAGMSPSTYLSSYANL